MAKDFQNEHDITCSFCGRGSREVSSLIEGPGKVFICDICVQNSVEIIKKNQKVEFSVFDEFGKLPLPSEIKSELDKYVIGQEYAKKVLSVAVYNHYKRISGGAAAPEFDDVELEKK
jgi:ATP-dependent Clp protease ATP-binding subunit ClpX